MSSNVSAVSDAFLRKQELSHPECIAFTSQREHSAAGRCLGFHCKCTTRVLVILSTDLRLHKPPFLPASAVAGLEVIGGVDGDAMDRVVQRGEVVPGGGSVSPGGWGEEKRRGVRNNRKMFSHSLAVY